MKIVYHHRTLGDGAEGIHVREMVKAFRELGHEVRVTGPVGEALPEGSRKLKFLESLKKRMPDFVYELCEMAYSAYSFWKISREVRCFRPDFIYDRYITFNVGAVLAGMVNHIPVCLEVNAPLAKERAVEKDERLTFRRIALRIEKWVCSNATRTIVVSTPLKEYLKSIGVPEGKCVVMPNGVDPRRFIPREKDLDLLKSLGIPVDAFVIGFTGILRPWHGLDLLIEVLGRLLRQSLKAFVLIVGDGPYRETIEKMVRDLKLEQCIRITGRVPHDEVPWYISLFDVGVSPRATFYASPMKAIEYMAVGRPVLVPRLSNFHDIVDEGINGIMFDDGNSCDLEKALVQLYRFSYLRQEMGSRAREKVERRLNWYWNVNEVCRLISEGYR